MKIKAKELRGMKDDELRDKLTEVRKELMKVNSQIAVGTMPESPGKVRQIKKTIARMLTILNERRKQPKAAAEAKEVAKKQ